MKNMTDEQEPKSKLKIRMEYNKLKAEIEGSYDEVWRSVNEFLQEVKQTTQTSTSLLAVAGKNVKEILVQLRDVGFFDEERTTFASYERLCELGKTDITRNAVSMALKELTTTGHLRRLKREKEYTYVAPWTKI